MSFFPLGAPTGRDGAAGSCAGSDEGACAESAAAKMRTPIMEKARTCMEAVLPPIGMPEVFDGLPKVQGSAKDAALQFEATRLLLADVFIPDGRIRANVVSEELKAFFGVEVDDFDAKRAKPIYATLEIAAFTQNHFLKTKLADESTAIPARSKCRDHDEIAVAALAAGVAESIGFAVERRIAKLNASIVA